MDLDDVLATWRGQAPLYEVDRDRLRGVLHHEQDALRRALRWEHGASAAVSALLLALAAVAFAAVALDDDPRTPWDVAAAGATAAVVLAGALAQWLGRRRQARRERAFGRSLRDEVRLSLSLLDSQLSGAGRREGALLAAAPITVAGALLYWLTVQINNIPFGVYDAGVIAMVVAGSAWSAIDASRRIERDLAPRRARLAELLDALQD